MLTSLRHPGRSSSGSTIGPSSRSRSSFRNDQPANGEGEQRKLSRPLVAAALGAIVLAAGWFASRSWATLPTCTSFAAHPEAVQRGETATLAWKTARAHSAFIQPDVGRMIKPSGSVRVQPAKSMTYTLYLSGKGGSATCEAAVKVEDPQPQPQLPPLAIEPVTLSPPPPESPRCLSLSAHHRRALIPSWCRIGPTLRPSWRQ